MGLIHTLKSGLQVPKIAASQWGTRACSLTMVGEPADRGLLHKMSDRYVTGKHPILRSKHCCGLVAFRSLRFAQGHNGPQSICTYIHFKVVVVSSGFGIQQAWIHLPTL